jgi:hypothetical protein
LACQTKFFVNNPLDVKENYEHALDFFSSPVSPFSVYLEPSMPFELLCTAHAFFPKHLSSQGLRPNFSEICTKVDAVLLSDPSRNRIWPDIRLNIKRRKNQHIPPAG